MAWAHHPLFMWRKRDVSFSLSLSFPQMNTIYSAYHETAAFVRQVVVLGCSGWSFFLGSRHEMNA
jgi:hypothetical protein